MSTLGVYVAKFFPRMWMAIVDASLPRILSVASTMYHGFWVWMWSAAFGYHVLFQMSYKFKTVDIPQLKQVSREERQNLTFKWIMKNNHIFLINK